jgi:ATP-dependent DNA helicase
MVPASDIADDVWALGARPPEASTASPKPRGRPPKGKKAAGKPARKAPIRPAKRKRGNDEDGEEQPKNTFPVVLTTYEMVIRDQKFLGAYSWGYIVVGKCMA